MSLEQAGQERPLQQSGVNVSRDSDAREKGRNAWDQTEGLQGGRWTDFLRICYMSDTALSLRRAERV